MVLIISICIPMRNSCEIEIDICIVQLTRCMEHMLPIIHNLAIIFGADVLLAVAWSHIYRPCVPGVFQSSHICFPSLSLAQGHSLIAQSWRELIVFSLPFSWLALYAHWNVFLLRPWLCFVFLFLSDFVVLFGFLSWLTLQFSNTAFLAVRGYAFSQLKWVLCSMPLSRPSVTKENGCTNRKHREDYKGSILKLSYPQNKLFSEKAPKLLLNPTADTAGTKSVSRNLDLWVLASKRRSSHLWLSVQDVICSLSHLLSSSAEFYRSLMCLRNKAIGNK